MRLSPTPSSASPGAARTGRRRLRHAARWTRHDAEAATPRPRPAARTSRSPLSDALVQPVRKGRLASSAGPLQLLDRALPIPRDRLHSLRVPAACRVWPPVRHLYVKTAGPNGLRRIFKDEELQASYDRPSMAQPIRIWLPERAGWDSNARPGLTPSAGLPDQSGFSPDNGLDVTPEPPLNGSTMPVST
jgi:hypothetical protein